MEDKKIIIVDYCLLDEGKILIASLCYPSGVTPKLNSILKSKEGKWRIVGIVFNKLKGKNTWDCKIERVDQKLKKGSFFLLCHE